MAAGNVLVPTILLLEERGYVLTVSRSDRECWIVRRGELELAGNDPLQLLALATLAEARGAAWVATDEQIQKTLGRFSLTGSLASRRSRSAAWAIRTMA
ncbi:MAG: hypothetical protein JOZ69_11705 [Myxococcales bacterium]|nr:hypothetical protein [Myxococcales bacterium]